MAWNSHVTMLSLDTSSSSLHQDPQPAKQQWLQQAQAWARNKGRRMVVPFFVVLLCACLVAWRAVQWTHSPFYHAAGYALPAAKCFVTIAEVCFGLLFLPVSRNLVTWLRSTWLKHIIDFDQGISHHKILAIIGASAGCAHGACISLAYYNARVLESTPKCTSCNWAWASGWGLVVIIMLTYPFAVFRGYLAGPKSGKTLSSFTNFWLSHHVLILLFTPLLVFHSIPALPKGDTEGGSLTSSKAWMFIVGPMMIYAVERLTRALRKVARKTDVLDARLLPGDVLELTLSKPRSFRFISGMYAYILCPTLSSFEWHPFTITSAPQDDFISLHIRKAGDWTAALHALVAGTNDTACSTITAHQQDKPGSDLAKPSSDLHIVTKDVGMPAMSDHDDASTVRSYSPTASVASSMRSALFKGPESEFHSLDVGRPLPAIFLDGPFGAPTQAWNDYEVVTLIGAGIGITPMSSVLRSLLHNLYLACCDKCGHINTRACAGIRQRKVHFHWVLRSADGMFWLERILETIAQADQQRRFELHVHITGAHCVPGALPAAVLESDSESLPDICAHHEAATHAGSVITGPSRNTVHYSCGRPDFNNILSDIQASHAGEVVGVFYCGPPALGHTLEAECRELNSQVLRPGSGGGAAAGGKARSSCTPGGAVGAGGKVVDVEACVGRGAQLHFYKEVF